MADTVGLKLATPEDAEAVINFLLQARQESDAITIPHLEQVTNADEARNITEINQSDDCVMMLAMLDDEVIGMVTVMKLGQESVTGELGVVVAKKYWRQGIGAMLVDEAEYWFDHYSSLQTLTLDVYEDNVPAINLYRKMNFTVREHIQVEQRPALQMDYQPVHE